MGSNRKLLSGVLLLVGAVVILGLYRMITNVTTTVATPTPVPQAQMVSQKRGSIARATMDIPQGSIVTKEMFEMVPLTGTGLPTGFVTDPETQAIGYITSTDIPKGAQLRPAEDFVGHITEVGIAGALRPNTRAMVVPFANKPTLHDLVRIGNYVDINAAFDGQEARTIISSVRVLAVDVFGNDFPEVKVAVRGPYKADIKPGTGPKVGPGVVSSSGAPVDPNATPTPAPTAAPARPDPALTLELTKEQANTLLLAQASGATIDFVLLPALPGGRNGEAVIAPGANGETETTATVRSVSVTKAQIAPYAERKKSAGASSGPRPSTGGRDGGGPIRPIREPIGNFNNPPMPTGITTPPAPITEPSGPPAAPPTYEIPIYADGKTVRVETVRRPQD